MEPMGRHLMRVYDWALAFAVSAQGCCGSAKIFRGSPKVAMSKALIRRRYQ